MIALCCAPMEDSDDAKPQRSLDGRKLALIGVAAAVLLAAALAGWFAWKGHKKAQDEVATIGRVAEATTLLREVLAAKAPPGATAALDASVQAIKAASRTPLADAAEDYVSGAREIARRRADAARLAPAAAASRQALLAHLEASNRRGGTWFRQAGELKKRMENVHFELGTALKTLDTLIDGMQESRKTILPLVGEQWVIEAAALTEGRQRAQAEIKRNVEELERARQIPLS
jgi:hypothetical protein